VLDASIPRVVEEEIEVNKRAFVPSISFVTHTPVLPQNSCSSRDVPQRVTIHSAPVSFPRAHPSWPKEVCREDRERYLLPTDVLVRLKSYHTIQWESLARTTGKATEGSDWYWTVKSQEGFVFGAAARHVSSFVTCSCVWVATIRHTSIENKWLPASGLSYLSQHRSSLLTQPFVFLGCAWSVPQVCISDFVPAFSEIICTLGYVKPAEKKKGKSTPTIVFVDFATLTKNLLAPTDTWVMDFYMTSLAVQGRLVSLVNSHRAKANLIPDISFAECFKNQGAAGLEEMMGCMRVPVSAGAPTAR
jgi:hypothetical protein